MRKYRNRVLLITGPAGYTHGWGREKEAQEICEALQVDGKNVKVLNTSTLDEFSRGLDENPCDIAWSSLYFISEKTDFIGAEFTGPWLSDLLDERGLNYVGATAETSKVMLDKVKTRNFLARSQIPVPEQHCVARGQVIPTINFPAFVKPRYESESTGVSEESVVLTRSDLTQRIRYVHENFEQSALVEEYLPGTEITVTVLGETSDQNLRFQPVVHLIDRSAYDQYPILMASHKRKKAVTLAKPGRWAGLAEKLAQDAVVTLGCRDHVRIDMKEDASGVLKVIEVNGIPGMAKEASRTLQINNLYTENLSEEENYRSLVNSIVDAALFRSGLI